MLMPDEVTQAGLQAHKPDIVWLVELQFTDATYRFSTWNRELQALGQTWRALGDLVSVPDLKESTELTTQTVPLRFTVANQALLAATLGSVEKYRGRRANIYLALLGPDYQVIATPRRRFSGTMQPVRVERDKRSAEQGGNVGGTIELPLNRLGMARSRNAEGERLTYQQHQHEHPGDEGLQFMQSLLQTPQPWISKAFQER